MYGFARLKSLPRRTYLLFFIGVIVFLCVRWPFGSMAALQHSLRGKSVLFHAPNLKHIETGTWEHIHVNVQNLTHWEQRIYGAKVGCGYTAPVNLPRVLAPRARRHLTFKVLGVEPYAGEERQIPVWLWIEGARDPIRIYLTVFVLRPGETLSPDMVAKGSANDCICVYLTFFRYPIYERRGMRSSTSCARRSRGLLRRGV